MLKIRSFSVQNKVAFLTKIYDFDSRLTGVLPKLRICGPNHHIFSKCQVNEALINPST